MRKGYYALSALVRSTMERDPLDGSVYIFINKRRDKMKLLVFERSGFVVYYKCLELGTFEMPMTKDSEITWNTLMLIMEGISLKSEHQRKRYK